MNEKQAQTIIFLDILEELKIHTELLNREVRAVEKIAESKKGQVQHYEKIEGLLKPKDKEGKNDGKKK